MPEENSLPMPIEVPWRLAATTQRLTAGFPEDTTISIFYYDPDTESLQVDYPEERLVYLKFTVSISPCQIESESLSELARSHLVGGLPVLHVVLDIGVTPDPFETGGIRPYFHAAAPTRRTMVETGVVGDAFYEGESESLSFGKSASQLHETISSQVTTKSKGWGLGLPGIVRGGKRTTSTTVGSERSLEEYLETVNREASEERRELLSHMTHVENILTLLSAKHVGSPFLRFSLSPRPLRPLTVDPGDPNLWYSQLLQRRSSGIEGIQEFFAVVAVPRNTNFCIQALLRRICVLDNPPTLPDFPEADSLSSDGAPADFQRIFDYLSEIYPRGTPLDALDVDLLGSPTLEGDSGDFIPSILVWAGFADEGEVIGPMVGYPHDAGPFNAFEYRITGLAYKTFAEVWLDMLHYEYLVDLARSPLERGVVLSHSTELRTCFRTPADGGTETSSSEAATPPPSAVPFEPAARYAAPQSLDRRRMAGQSDPTEAVARWNALDEELAAQAGRIREREQPPLSLDDPKIIQFFLRQWRKLPADDRRNLPLERAASLLGLSADDVSLLEKAGVEDLKGLAGALLAAGRIERRNRKLENFMTKLDEKQRCRIDLKTMAYPLTGRDAERLRAVIGVALQGSGDRYTGEETQQG